MGKITRSALASLFVVTLAIPFASAAEVEIGMGDFFFDPQLATAEPGDTVTWTNFGFAGHTATSGEGLTDPNSGADFDTPLLFSGMTASVDFPSELEAEYYCIPHGSFMYGHLIVGGSGVRCAMVPDDTSLTAGQPVSFNAYVRNFEATSQSVSIEITGMAPNGQSATLVNVNVTVPADGELSNGLSVNIPPSLPVGDYEFTMTCTDAAGAESSDVDVYSRLSDNGARVTYPEEFDFRKAVVTVHGSDAGDRLITP